MYTRITSHDVDFFAPLRANRLSTFVPTKKAKTTKEAKAEMTNSDRSLFARLLVVGRTREIDLEKIMSYPLCAVSVPLATADGSMYTIKKSDLMLVIESECPDCIIEHTKDTSALIVDSMVLIRSLPAHAIPSTFGELADVILKLLIGRSRKYNAERVDFVIDTYITPSIKGAERSKRGDTTHVRELHISNKHVKIPNDWQTFLKAGVNKSAMLKFIVEHWMQTATGCPIMLYVTTEKSCSRLVLSQDQPPICETVPALTTDHEEADTRLIMHAVHASEQFRAVIIDSVDADVGVMALGHSKKFLCEQLALLTGKSENKRLIDLTAVSEKLGERMIQALIGLHAFTGCDFTSGFVISW